MRMRLPEAGMTDVAANRYVNAAADVTAPPGCDVTTMSCAPASTSDSVQMICDALLTVTSHVSPPTVTVTGISTETTSIGIYNPRVQAIFAS